MTFRTVSTPDGALQIAQLGFGCARLYAGYETRASTLLLEHAYKLGIRHFDTAPMYGHGQSENLLGLVFGSAKDVTITTKIGIARPHGQPGIVSVLKRRTFKRVLSFFPGVKNQLLGLKQARGNTTGDDQIARTILSANVVQQGLEESLLRLRRDTVDILLVHEPDQYLLDTGLQHVFENVKRQQLICAFGLAYGRPVLQPGRFGDVVQSGFSDKSEAAPALRLYHGVLRANPHGAVETLAVAMRAHPESGFIISASERHQLTSLVRNLEKARVMKTMP